MFLKIVLECISKALWESEGKGVTCYGFWNLLLGFWTFQYVDFITSGRLHFLDFGTFVLREFGIWDFGTLGLLEFGTCSLADVFVLVCRFVDPLTS